MAGRHARPSRAAARAGEFARPRQQLSRNARRARLSRVARITRGVLGATAAVSAAVTLGVVGGSGTFAIWSASSSLTAPSLESGDASLLITGDPIAVTNVLPGETFHPAQELTVTNTGDVDLAVTVTIATARPGHEFRALIVGLGQTCGSLAGAALPALGSAPDQAQPVVIVPKGTSMTLCTEVTVLPTAAPSGTASYQVLLSGRQAA
ncbi:MAG: hypothetical protein J7480_03735 [Microbacteriaceae bacterium]|nr:hypothetical protein [Microbacteriaceae bacterium]